MRSRFFGASSWDEDEEDYDEMDLSGFVSEPASPKPPVVVERKRGSSGGAAQATQGMGNAGSRPTTPPPPMSDMGYRPAVQSPITFKEGGEGSPWNPVWAADESALRKPAVISKSVGMMVAVGGVAYAAGKRKIGGAPVRMIAAGTAMYLHPALGFNHGFLDQKLANRGALVQLPVKGLTHVAGAAVFYTLIKRGGLRK